MEVFASRNVEANMAVADFAEKKVVVANDASCAAFICSRAGLRLP